jgi:hypothetical protein
MAQHICQSSKVKQSTEELFDFDNNADNETSLCCWLFKNSDMKGNRMSVKFFNTCSKVVIIRLNNY